MPAYYTHYRLGKQALPEFPAQVRQSVQRFRRLFDMGLQGPDFFFYRDAIHPSAEGLGHKFHFQTGREFFAHACTQAGSEAARVYLIGLLGHYCLDSLCHPFVVKMDAEGKARHVALESEFERSLLEADGKVPPWCQDFSKRMKLTRGECVTVAAFYPDTAPGAVWTSVTLMRLCSHYFSSKKREKVERQLRFLGRNLQDHLIPEEPVAEFARMDSELLRRYNQALRSYPQMLTQLLAHLDHGQPLGEEFEPIFG